ncbi:hypothetical protein ACFYWN_23585 [Streptomyces sp. NPDC002917]|uniref:hypothetical protein n=1 Tax=unclassified Streptomyces TaxID=2593676 RepID=UPI0036826560|nr:hypothetical protein OHB03_02945 [Streptomyces sp. NBC_01643]
MADTFSSAMSYGWVQSGPPILTRGGVRGGAQGAIDGTRRRPTKPIRITTDGLPNFCSPYL